VTLTLVTDRDELNALDVEPDVPAAVIVRSGKASIVLSIELLREVVAQYDAIEAGKKA
jgi:hypothetical protein